MEFQAIHSNETFPLGGYDSYIFRVRVNPTGKTKEDWWRGILEDPGCPRCAEQRASAPDAGGYCETCQELRKRKGRAAVAIYGETKIQGVDFSTPEASLASLLQPELPDDVLGWLLALPDVLWQRRSEELKKKLIGSSTEATPS